MLSEEKIAELQEAFDVLVKHNLYRRGAVDLKTVDITPGELGEAIDLAAGVVLEYIQMNEDIVRERKAKEMYSKQVKHYHDQWINAEKSIKVLEKELAKYKADYKRLSVLLAGHKIKYKKDKKNA